MAGYGALAFESGRAQTVQSRLSSALLTFDNADAGDGVKQEKMTAWGTIAGLEAVKDGPQGGEWPPPENPP